MREDGKRQQEELHDGPEGREEDCDDVEYFEDGPAQDAPGGDDCARNNILDLGHGQGARGDYDERGDDDDDGWSVGSFGGWVRKLLGELYWYFASGMYIHNKVLRRYMDPRAVLGRYLQLR